MGHNHYLRLLYMTLLSFAAMYVLMYAMVDSIANALPNLNQVYMAALMTAAMVVIELALMGSMYENRKWNALILAAGVAGMALFWGLIRWQSAISDTQFLKSMIPHHASAILMCRQADLANPANKDLCERILASQSSEIREMRDRLQAARREGA